MDESRAGIGGRQRREAFTFHSKAFIIFFFGGFCLINSEKFGIYELLCLDWKARREREVSRPEGDPGTRILGIYEED